MKILKNIKNALLVSAKNINKRISWPMVIMWWAVGILSYIHDGNMIGIYVPSLFTGTAALLMVNDRVYKSYFRTKF